MKVIFTQNFEIGSLFLVSGIPDEKPDAILIPDDLYVACVFSLEAYRI